MGGGGGRVLITFHGKCKMAVSHFTDNKFGISRFKRKKFLYDQFCLFWLRTTAKELPCSMSPPFSRFLFLVL